MHTRKKNPLKNFDEMVRLNPYASVVKRAEIMAHQKKGKKDKKRKLPAGGAAEVRKIQKTFYDSMMAEPEEAVAEEEEEVEEEAGEAAAAAPAAAAAEADLDDY